MSNDWDLKFWTSKAWAQTQEKLHALDISGTSYNPSRENLFAALDILPYGRIRCAILGQDPYPQPSFATGIAFSIPMGVVRFPPTLTNIFLEYVSDLHHPFPRFGDLTSWCEQGVFLFNVFPTCETGKPGSHRSWVEWREFSGEVVGLLKDKRIPIVALGGLAREFVHEYEHAMCYSHPSPLGVSKTSSPFKGSRIFSTINAKLCARGEEPIDWRL